MHFHLQLPCLLAHRLCLGCISHRFSCICVQSDAVRVPITRSPLALNLPAFLPPGSGDGERPPWGHNAPCSRSQEPNCCSFLITHNPHACANPLYNSTAKSQVGGQIIFSCFFPPSAALYYRHCNRGCCCCGLRNIPRLMFNIVRYTHEAYAEAQASRICRASFISYLFVICNLARNCK